MLTETKDCEITLFIYDRYSDIALTEFSSLILLVLIFFL